jgi:HD-GYP domain-containing protein (c-di-GMP phosphodiesterase class II)
MQTRTLTEQKIDVAHLATGMYVYRLDRDWLGTPFSLEGFYIRSPEDIQTLRKICDYVIIDLKRSNLNFIVSKYHEKPLEEKLKVREYFNTTTIAEELPKAKVAHQNASTLAANIISDLRVGKKLNLDDVRSAVGPVVQSVLRNPDAFFWISSLRKRDAYQYSHAINCSLLAAALGRHMGFAESVLMNLATGGMLLDVGKAELPQDLLDNFEPLSKTEMVLMRRHVAFSMQILESSGIHNLDVINMVRTHHERYDGSGYPSHLIRNQIPLFGRMAGVIDSYDAMTSHRPYRQAMSQHKALQEIYRKRNVLYQSDIIEQFLQCLSVYPTGSLVELNTGAVAIVMAQNQARRLRPRVMVLTGPDKKLKEHFEEVDLFMHALSEDSLPHLEIVNTLENGAYDIEPSELYLL